MRKTICRHFLSDRRGNISITTGVVGVMLLTAVGATMDGGRMFSTKQKLQSITDAAALSATMPKGISSERRRDIARQSIESHVQQTRGLDIDQTHIEIIENGRQVKVSLASEVPMIFGAVLGSDQRRVSVSSVAEESSNNASLSNMSISVVLDLSSSMSDSLDQGSKLNSVKSALSDTLTMIGSEFGGDAVAATRLNTGLYPFNWGQVDGKTVPLGAGADDVKTMMNFLPLSEGSVPSEAMERAVGDMLDYNGSSDQNYIVYISDGRVDDERADEPGRYLSTASIKQESRSNSCKTSTIKLENRARLYDRVLNLVSRIDRSFGYTSELNSGNSANVDMAHDNIEKYGRKLHRALRRGGCRGLCQVVGDALDEFETARTNVTLDCKPTQTQRIVDACRTARENNVSLIAIDLVSDHKEGEDIANLCVNPDFVAAAAGNENARSEMNPAQRLAGVNDNPKTVLPSGLEVTLSVDGKSMAATVSTMAELRDVLATMIPEAKQGERVVRLVG